MTAGYTVYLTTPKYVALRDIMHQIVSMVFRDLHRPIHRTVFCSWSCGLFYLLLIVELTKRHPCFCRKLVDRLESLKKLASGNGVTDCVLCGDSFGLSVFGRSNYRCCDCKKVSSYLICVTKSQFLFVEWKTQTCFWPLLVLRGDFRNRNPCLQPDLVLLSMERKFDFHTLSPFVLCHIFQVYSRISSITPTSLVLGGHYFPLVSSRK